MNPVDHTHENPVTIILRPYHPATIHGDHLILYPMLLSQGTLFKTFQNQWPDA